MRISLSSGSRLASHGSWTGTLQRGVGAARVLALVAPLCLSACDEEDPTIGPGPGLGGQLDASISPATRNDAAVVLDAGGGGAVGGGTVGGSGGTVSGAADAGRPPQLDAGGGPPAPTDGGVPPTRTDGATPAPGDGGGAGGGGPCTRESLTAAVNSYFTALSMKNHMSLMVAPTVKFTQDAMQMQLGEGLWKTAGEVKFKRSAYDTQQCETVTESVVVNGTQDFIVGVRLKLANGLISEIETVLVGPDGWFPNPRAVISSASDNWEMVLPEAERSTRDFIKTEIVDGYFVKLFAGTIAVSDYPFASTCKRAENGFSPGACDFGIPTLGAMMPLHYVIDVEAGIGVGFVLFGGRTSGMLDFHMFRVKSKEVHGVRAVVGPSVRGRGWP
jgi:hypothetical protein